MTYNNNSNLDNRKCELQQPINFLIGPTTVGCNLSADLIHVNFMLRYKQSTNSAVFRVKAPKGIYLKSKYSSYNNFVQKFQMVTWVSTYSSDKQATKTDKCFKKMQRLVIDKPILHCLHNCLCLHAYTYLVLHTGSIKLGFNAFLFVQ